VALNIYRRHLESCKHRAAGAAYTKCSCPIWCDGELNGRRYRKSLGVRDWQRAMRKLAALESPDLIHYKEIPEAIAAFEQHCAELEPSTRRKYRNVMTQFGAYCERIGLGDVGALSVEHLDAYRAGRKLAPTTSTKELQTLRQFLGFCFDRRWVTENAAKRIKAPANVKPEPVEPYTPTEIAKIIGACDFIGKTSYERLRARAMVLLLRYTGLRISDVATLGRDRIHHGQILLHTQKTGGMVFLPVKAELQAALDALPAPRGAEREPRYYFWNGVCSRRCVVGMAERTMAAVFAKSGVSKAHAHRFRHTLATDILAGGGTEQDVADILGISANVVRKHYAKWSPARQERITRLMGALEFGTNLVHEKNRACN